MRKVFLFAVLALFLLTPSLAGAQAALVLDQVTIQVWPEFDQPAALVIVDLRLAANTPLPQTLRVRIPRDANLIAVAMDAGEGLFTVQYEPPVLDGDYEVLSLSVTESAVYRLEYYAPLKKNGITRSYELLWPGDYVVKKMLVSVQKPVGARNLQTIPALAEALPAADGFVYSQGTFEDLAAGETFRLNLQYEKDDDSLSVEQQSPQPGAPLENAQGSTITLTMMLPWLVGGLGVVLIAGGAYWYWQSGRASTGKSSSRRRSANQSDDEIDNRVYCSQCGKRAEASDRFCRACGARLRKE